MIVAEIMTRDPVTVAPGASIADAAQLMLDRHISGLPVKAGDGALVGVVTEGDLLRRAETGTARRRPRWLEFLVGPGRLAGDYVDTHGRKVGEVMTAQVVSVAPNAPLDSVVTLMEQRHIKRVPVVAKGRLVGIVSRADLVRALLDSLKQSGAASSKPVDDSEIRSTLSGIIDREPWGPRFSVEVAVENGTVELFGTVSDERERLAVKVAAENIAGVKTVRDHLVWVEPNSGLVFPAESEGV
jgi:CBS domain-containing protein